jgi:hypothetical protein
MLPSVPELGPTATKRLTTKEERRQSRCYVTKKKKKKKKKTQTFIAKSVLPGTDREASSTCTTEKNRIAKVNRQAVATT